MPSPIQKATAGADEAIHALVAIDKQIEEAAAKISSLEAESAAATETADTLDARATIKLRVSGQIAAMKDVLADLETQRSAAEGTFIAAKEALGVAQAQKHFDTLAQNSAEIANLLTKAKGLMKEMAEAEKTLGTYISSPVPKMRGYAEHLIAELFHGVLPGVNAARHPKGLCHEDLARLHYGKTTASAIEDQTKVARHFAKNHWLMKRDSDADAYLAGRAKLERNSKAKPAKKASEVA